jgi:hypothetical protein
MADLDGEGTLAFIKELTKSVADLNKEIGKTGEQAGTGVRKGTEETEKFGKTVERHTHHLEGMNLSMGRLGGLVRGFGAGAALATGAFQAMQAHVTQGLNLRNLSTDLGISAQAINRLRIQLSAAGVDSKVADSQISTLMGKLDELRTLETASSVYKDLAANDPKFAAALLNAEKYGDRLQAIALIQEKLGRTNEPRSTLYTQGVLGLNPSTSAALNKDFKGRLIELRTYSEAELEEFNVFVTNMSTVTKNAWGGAMQYSVESTNEMIRNTKGEIEGLKNFYNRTFENGGPLSNEKVIEFFSNFFSVGKAKAEEHRQEQLKFNERWEGESDFKDRFGTWGDTQDEGALPLNAAPTSLTREALAHDELDVEKSSNSVLRDIFNALDESRKGETGSSGSSGAVAPGPSSSGGGGTPSASAPAPGPSGGGSPVTASARGPQTSAPPADTGTGSVSAVPPMGANVSAKIAPGGGDVDEAIRATAGKAGMSEANWKAIASIESSLNPGSNANARTQYKGLFQIGARGADSEWARRGSGNIYNARDNAEAAAALAQDNAARFRKLKGRDPTASEIYLMHQQGFGFYSRGAMTNIGGNLPPSLKGRSPATITHDEFEQGWAREIERRASRYAVPGSAAKTAEARRSMDKSLVAPTDLGGAKIKVDFGDLANQKTGVAVVDSQPFKKLKIDRAPQAPSAGGGTADFNRFAFE